MEVVSLNVALPSTQRYGEHGLFTGGAKRPVPRAMLRTYGFDGDGQADTQNHGGLDKAVCVYPFDHYPRWERVLGRELTPGAFSENLTISGIRETEVRVGDVFRAGEATMQVCQPRVPCDKLARKNGERLLPRWMSGTGYTGFYMRVLAEGPVDAGSSFKLIERHPDNITIADANDAIYDRCRDVDLVERLANLPEFGAAGRAMFARRLERLRHERIGGR